MINCIHIRRNLYGIIALLVLVVTTATAQTTVPSWQPTALLPTPLVGHGTILLPTGEVLVTGGITSSGAVTRTSYLYSSTTGGFRPTINQLASPRAYHALVDVRSNGSTAIFAIGGFNGTTGDYHGDATVELLEYDAGAQNWRWRTIGSLGASRGDLRATYDGLDHIIVSGGYVQNGGALRSGKRSTACDRISITSLKIEPIGPMIAPRAEHATARFVDAPGVAALLVAGGEENPQGTATQLLSGTTWDPIANPPLAYHTGAVGVGDPAGVARVFGGFDSLTQSLASCEWYDAKRGWRAAPRMATARGRFDASLVAGVTDTAMAYLAIGGIGTTSPLADAELFFLPNASFPNGSWTPFPSLAVAGSERRIAITGSNLPLVTGGGRATPLDGCELFQPLRANDIAFGDEELGRRSDSSVVTVENTWLLPVRVRNFRIAGSAEFIYRGDTADFTIPPGGRSTLRLYFQPSVAGPRTGSLLFDVGPFTDSVRLAGRGIASQISVINSPLDFGTLLVRTNRSDCRYLLRNNGTDTAVIDSVVIDPSDQFRLLSPRGRVSLPPGDSLQICVEFLPTSQGVKIATATLHISTRSFPIQIFGKGIRRYLRATVVSSECDTVVFTPGAEVSGFITIENPGDTLVHVEMPVLKSSNTSLFRLADSTLFPRDILPGNALLVEVIFTPQREAQETVTIDIPNNGDTSASVSLCFIARSRLLSVSQSTVDFGSICQADTATAFVTIENPGGFDPVDLLAADVTPNTTFTLVGFTPGRLGPREYTTVSVRYIALQTGVATGTLRLQSSRGDVTIPLAGRGLASAQFVLRDATIMIGDTVEIPVDLSGVAPSSGFSAAVLHLRYDPTLVIPLGVKSITGAAPLDEVASRVVITGRGGATIDLVWKNATTTNGPSFALVTEALRGDATLAPITLEGERSNGFCIAPSRSLITLAPLCPVNSGGIRSTGAEFVTVSPLPTSDALNIMVVTPESDDVVIDLVTLLGRPLAQQIISGVGGESRTTTMRVGEIPSGFYLLRARIGRRTIGVERVMIAH